MARSNTYFRRDLLNHTPSTGGVSDYLLSTVGMLKAAFPAGVVIDSPDYRAVWSFLDHQQFTHRVSPRFSTSRSASAMQTSSTLML